VVKIEKKPGDLVKAGDVIMQLENMQLRFELAGMKGQLEEAEQRLSSLRRARFSDSDLVDQLATAEKDRDAKQKLYDDKLKEIDRLTIKAPRDGYIIPMPHKVDRAAKAEGRLATWAGSPFDDRNMHATFQPTELICQIGDPKDLDAVLVIDQSYIDYVREGQAVRVLLEADTQHAYNTKVDEIAENEMKSLPPQMSTKAGGRMEAKQDPTGQMRPLTTSYQARARLGDVTGIAQVGLQGQARIYTGWQSIRERVYRAFTKTFHFDL
jgi:putative peptide zinc metalloprotease protein